MQGFTEMEKVQIRLFGELIFVNPFSVERTSIEKKLLGRSFRSLYEAWHSVNGELSVNGNLAAINELSEQLVARGMQGCAKAEGEAFLDSWDLLVMYWLFGKYSGPMCRNIYLGRDAESENALLFKDFNADFAKAVNFHGRTRKSDYCAENIFALFHQIHRAFNYIFDFIAGGSMAAAQMRSSIWQSIFTYDLRRYYRQMYSRMDSITTLICGESGTGKELVARSIAFSQFIPFNARKHKFEEVYLNCFHPVQLSAMPQTLVESELFGHAKGAFTGAISEVKGYFETCQKCGSIFLDEIGDVCPETQAKLLRLLQTRQFNRIGDARQLSFQGKVIAATNQDLFRLCQEGSFRNDLFFRICSDTIHTAPLRQLIDGQEDELRKFVVTLAKRMLDGEDAQDFADKCGDWIMANLGVDYAWPGNVREMEQCLRNLLIRGEYRPPANDNATGHDSTEDFFSNCRMTADELMRRYIGAIHKREGTIAATATITGLDRRTVKKYL